MFTNLRKILALLFICCAQIVAAQSISVSSFKLLENDLAANTTGTMERDQNGEVAALIKVVTTEQGFVFDGGMSGIVKTKQGVGEVWVYVPHGIRRITIQHPQLGVLRDYYFSIPIEKAKTYEMVLTTGKVNTVVSHTVNKQFVVFNVKPANAVVDFNEEVLPVDGDGVAQKLVPYGTYDYRVTHSDYHTTAGKVTVGAQGKAEVNVTLRPNFGWINVDGGNECRGAYVYIDNERVGELPFKSSELKSGTHRVKVVKSMYKTYEHQVTVSDNETVELNVELVPNFASVTLKAGEDCEIWVDGQRKGNTQWQGPLEIGEYVIEVRKASHHSSSEILNVIGPEERIIQLKLPTPINTSLELISTPSHAMVYIDGVESGTTPLFVNDILVGAHHIEFRKEGYGSVVQSVNLQEGEENKVSVELTNQQEMKIVSSPSGADVSIDGTYQGVTPLETTLDYGIHTLRFTKNGYNTESKTIDVNSQTSTISQVLSLVNQNVEITSNPSGASVEINGDYKGITPLNISLALGEHFIFISKNGYKNYAAYRSIPTNNNKDFYFVLDKVTPIDVWVNITSDPISAATIDGKYIGSTPVKTKLKTGHHSLSLSRDGFKSIIEDLDVTSLNNKFHYNLDFKSAYRKKLSYQSLDSHVKSYTMGNFYLEGNAEVSDKGSFGFGGTFGAYLGGWNYDFSYQPLASELLIMRTGWGFRCGRNFLITPQVGWGNHLDVLCSSHSWGHVIEVFSISCRTQYCFSKLFAINMSTEYLFPQHNDIHSSVTSPVGGLYLRAGLVINCDLSFLNN